MRLIFAGTPEFARTALSALHHAGHEIVAVLTQPDRASGRGLALSVSPVKEEAIRLGLPVMQPASLKADRPEVDQARRDLEALTPELMVVAAYGLLLPRAVLDIPRWGCLNIHASLLPRWRGAAPIQAAIAAGDKKTGIALMQMEEGLDTGPVWASLETEITEADNFQTLHDRLAEMGANAVVALLREFPPSPRSRETARPRPQPEAGAAYAHKISKAQTWLDWRQSAVMLAAKVRALDPAPGALTRLDGETIKIFKAQAQPSRQSEALKTLVPGQIIEVDKQAIRVVCGDGILSLTVLQRPGARRLDAREFLNGKRVVVGQSFLPYSE